MANGCYPEQGASDHHVHVWNVADGEEVLTYTNHDDIVIAVAISRDDKLAAMAGGKGFPIHVWDLKTGETQQALVGTGTTNWAVGFSPDEPKVVRGMPWNLDIA